MPSEMALHPGNVQGYNNLIQIAGSNVVIRHNPGINEVEQIDAATEVDKVFHGKTARSAGTIHKGPQPSPEPNGDGTSAAGVPEKRQSDGQATAKEEKRGPRGRWDSSRPNGALGVVSLASPEQPRKTGSSQQWPRPTNFPQAKSRSSERPQEPRDNRANDTGQGRSSLSS